MRTVPFTAKLQATVRYLLGTDTVCVLTDLHRPKEYAGVLLYPTDDLLLTQPQFAALCQSISQEDHLYVFQMGDSAALCNQDRTVCELTAPFFDDEYRSLEFYSISVIISAKGEFALVIDESLEGGIGLLFATHSFADRFTTANGNTERDIARLKRFFKEDSKRNPQAMAYEETLLSLIE